MTRLGTTEYEFSDYDLSDRIITFVEVETGEVRDFSFQENGEFTNFVHQGQTHGGRVGVAIHIDADGDGTQDSWVFEGNTVRLQNHR